MKLFPLVLAALLISTTSVSAQTVMDLNEGLRVEKSSDTGPMTVSWYGRSQRTYVIDLSEDLINWAEAPFVEVGVGAPLHYGLMTTGQRLFFRLRFADRFDTDSDGLQDWEEIKFGTSATKPDTDDDGIPDAWEIDHGMNPNSAADAIADFDGDGSSNLFEYALGLQLGTPPTLYDGNGNGIPDCYERAAGLAILQTSSVDRFVMSYSYDALGQLISGPGRTYRLDAEGNILGLAQ
ncbi:MAG TPA: hypothetical protein DCQ04_16395 [Actinobacteria bacterium]|nr:hypothetical protein [Actinomycetota bacterium]